METTTAMLERPLERFQTSSGTLGRRTSRMGPPRLYTSLFQGERPFPPTAAVVSIWAVEGRTGAPVQREEPLQETGNRPITADDGLILRRLPSMARCEASWSNALGALHHAIIRRNCGTRIFRDDGGPWDMAERVEGLGRIPPSVGLIHPRGPLDPPRFQPCGVGTDLALKGPIWPRVPSPPCSSPWA